jgi:hypothetical protein
MTTDELQLLWQAFDTKLDAVSRSNERLVRDASLGRASTALDRLARTVRIEVAINAFGVLLLGSFAANHHGEWLMLAAAIPLWVCALGLVVAGIVQLVAIANVGYDGPIIAIAGALDRLHLLRARVTMWTFVLAPLIWPALAIVTVGAVSGENALSALGQAWILANVAFGVSVLVIARLLAWRFATRGVPPLVRQMFDALSGKDVVAARKQLASLLAYESSID